MSYQFAHLETYSRKANSKGQSTAFVFDEASREPSASHHVEHPAPPVQVFGMSLEELRAFHDSKAEATKTTNAKGQSRAIRKDQHTLCTVILSHQGGDGIDAWQADSVDWLKKKYGSSLKSVIRHDDEAHPHLHCYIVPDDMRAKALHPGAAAKELAMRSGADNKVGDLAYRQAMREWQDSYWEEVGLKHGMTRLGPGQRRMSRAAWKAEQAQAELYSRVEGRLKERGGEVAGREVELERQRRELIELAAQAKADHDAARAMRDLAAKELVSARRQAKAIISQAEAQAEPMRRLGARLGRVWSGFRGVEEALNRRADERVERVRQAAKVKFGEARDAIRAELRSEFGGRLAAAERAAAGKDQAVAELARERERRQAAEAEREVFRRRWSTADNELAERGRGRRLG